jgi:serine/threonine protein kinase
MSRSVGEHVKCPEGTLINGRFKVLREIGCGNFAKVYKCADVQHPTASPVAVKILKKEYAADAAFEADILKALNAKDSRGYKVVRMLDQFTWSRCPCFVFTLCGPCLRSRKLGIARGHLTMDELKRFSKQMIETLVFLHHHVRMVHTDLKPENIMIDDEVLPNPNSGIGSGWTIGDFGSASFYNPAKPDADLISTRPYRAPEVVLAMTWSTKADIFSMGCIFFELYYGARLFEVNEDAEHLGLFEKRLGKLPLHLTRQSKNFRRFFDANGVLLRTSAVPAYGGTTARSSSVPQVGTRHLGEVVPDAEFRDLLAMMLDVDPSRRASAQDCLMHPFLTGAQIAAPVSPLRAQFARMALQDVAHPNAAPHSSAPMDKENFTTANAHHNVPVSKRISPAVPSFNAPPRPISLGLATDRYTAASAADRYAPGYAPASARAPLDGLGAAAGKPSAFTPRYQMTRW